MEFAITAEQAAFQDSLRRTLERLSPLETVRAAASDAPFAAEVWDGLVELGLPALLVPEEHGGLGLGLLDAALAAEALGRACASTPFAGSALAAYAIAMGGSEEQKAAWLPRLAAGEAIGGLAISEATAGERDGAGVTALNGRMTGKALFALDGLAADVLIVADTAGALHLVDGAGVARRAMTSIDDTRSLAELTFDGTPCEPLAEGTLARVRDAAFVLLAADALGAGEHMLGAAVEYAKTRVQFNRVIGSFQAVKHLAAEMAAELEPCRALIWYAAYALDTGLPDGPLAAAHAKALLSDVGRFVARTSTEIHGGMGITDLLGLHFWFKRLGLTRQLLGGPEKVREHAARLQGWA